ncbi:hypothetical protein BRCON_2141 [Candidatus Sumerlaea chitinivorans]|uniref:DUF3644 domain-containing protein n=1 Tax=Sumerlaea chitinivorans TaxID=2250252 RepID=A0A2Z4Y7V2_SUMC1|nr:hypothetical protein BRCON_2141 [Candidatus Sumerlaea chitinivorans]
MKARSRELLDRAIAAMVAAIDVYNKPDFAYRAESFTILALNAWELLLKARWLALHRNRLSSLYVRQGKADTSLPRYKRARSGNPMTHSLDYLAKKLTEQRQLDENARRNLEALCELRDTAVHFYHRSPELNERVQEIGMACLKNFVAAVQDWFQEDLSRFNFYLMPLSFVAPPPSLEAIQLNRQEKSFLAFLDRLTPEQEDPAARYSVAVNVEVRFVRSKAASAPSVRVTNDPNAPAVRLSEEQIRERYPWDYKELTNRCRQRYSDFKVDQKYHQLRKSLESDRRFAHERRLDPEKPRPKKIFYAPAILEQFDKHYHRRQ